MIASSLVLFSGLAVLCGGCAVGLPVHAFRRRCGRHPDVVAKEKHDVITIARQAVNVSTFSGRRRHTCILAASDNLGLLFFRSVKNGAVRSRQTVPLSRILAADLEVNGAIFPADVAGSDPAERADRTLASMDPEAVAAIRTISLRLRFRDDAEQRERRLSVPMLQGGDARGQTPDIFRNALWWRDYLLFAAAVPTSPGTETDAGEASGACAPENNGAERRVR